MWPFKKKLKVSIPDNEIILDNKTMSALVFHDDGRVEIYMNDEGGVSDTLCAVMVMTIIDQDMAFKCIENFDEKIKDYHAQTKVPQD